MKYILGVSGYFHDSSVCLLKNSQLIEFVKEESLTRIKGSRGFPFRALTFLIAKYGLDNDNIDHIAFYEKPLRGWAATIYNSLAKPKRSFDLLRSQIKQFWSGPIHFASEVRKVIRIDENKLVFVPHHLSHALTALAFVSPQLQSKELLHFVFDGVGDGNTTSIFRTQKNDAQILFQQDFPHSLGLFYSAVTDYCGFLVNEGEYKLMALAAYGKPVYFDFFREHIFNIEVPKFELDMSWFDYDVSPERSYSDKWVNKFGPPILEGEINKMTGESFERAANLALSSQLILEEVINSTIEWGVEETGVQNITISGGVAQNSLAMCSASKISSIASITVPPSPGDSGAAIGAANFAKMMGGSKSIHCKEIFFGHSQLEFESALFQDMFCLEKSFSHMDEMLDDLIGSGEIICCYFGGNEIGPRALCNRSIICAANNKESVRALNLKIKKREEFRPLAPVMLRPVAQAWFEINQKVSDCYRWMALTTTAKEKFPSEYTAVLHVDRTARVQILDDEMHPLHAFLRRNSGKIDMLVNTSFNVAGDPIVFDAIDCYVNMSRLGATYMITDNGLYSLKA
ncbi:hypothetical protein N9F22_02200 [Alphaproteobacteria bacterium]|nr:hypothetical protein [Alphaproteobacteria bacterium]